MFRHIIVPVDFTDKNRAALDRAVELALQSAGVLTLLHVIEVLETEEDEELRDFYARLEARSRERMRALLESLPEGSFTARSEILFGPRPATICALAREEEADLIVLSSHRVEREEVAGGLFSLSYKVAILAPCSVLLVK